MNIKNVYILDDRAILYLNGEDTKDFLQNLISNDINKVSETNTCLLLYYLLKENFYMSL
jgi:folate-binding Fe-S cluster repair protein YgfZ